MSDFYIKQNDTSPAIRAQFLDNDKNPVSIVGGSVKFKMSVYNTGELIVNDSAVISDGEEGIAYYVWSPEDTAIAGTFKAEFEVTYSDTYVETFPHDGYLTIQIDADLD